MFYNKNMTSFSFLIRYQRGSRSLAENLKAQDVAPIAVATGGSQIAKEDDDDDYDIPEEIEDVIGKE